MLKVCEILQSSAGKLFSGSGNLAVRGFSIDSRTIKKDEAFIAIKGGNFDGHDFIAAAVKKSASCIIINNKFKSSLSSGLLKKATFVGVEDTLKALADIASFNRLKYNIPLIAITGSAGKTTAKEMLYWILADKFKVLKNPGTQNNHIGLPMALLKLNKAFDLAVVELGTSHSGEIKNLVKICRPNIGLITNIAAAHLEYFRSLRGVFKEKCSLISNLEKPFIAFLNADDRFLAKKLSRKSYKPLIFSFGKNKISDFTASNISYAKGRINFSVNKKHKFCLKTYGLHNLYNALASIGIARILGMEYNDIRRRLVSFSFPEGRLNLLEIEKIRFIDDSYNSNPFSFKNALEALDNFEVAGRKILIMGDMLELGGVSEKLHRDAGIHAAQVCDTLVTVGKYSRNAALAARLSGFIEEKIFVCENSSQAQKILFEKISPTKHDIILIKGSRAMKMEKILSTKE